LKRPGPLRRIALESFLIGEWPKIGPAMVFTGDSCTPLSAGVYQSAS